MRHYEYGEVVLTAAGEPIEAISLPGLSGRQGPRLAEPPQHREHLEAVEAGVREAWLMTQSGSTNTVLFLQTIFSLRCLQFERMQTACGAIHHYLRLNGLNNPEPFMHHSSRHDGNVE